MVLGSEVHRVLLHLVLRKKVEYHSLLVLAEGSHYHLEFFYSLLQKDQQLAHCDRSLLAF